MRAWGRLLSIMHGIRRIMARAGSDSSMTRRRTQFAGIVFVLLCGVVVAIAHAQGGSPSSEPVLDGIVTRYRTASSSWLPRLLPIAQRTFATLAAIEFAISGLLWGLRRDSLDEIAAKFLIKFTLTAFLLTLITSFGSWIPTIIDGFAVAGEHATGVCRTLTVRCARDRMAPLCRDARRHLDEECNPKSD